MTTLIKEIDYGTPKVDAGKFELEVMGLVEKPVKLSLDAIKARPRQEQHQPQCARPCHNHGSKSGAT